MDHASHTHVPAVSIRSHKQSDDLSICTGHAAAVSFQSSSIGGNNCIGSLSDGSFAPIAFVDYLLVWLNRNFGMNRKRSGRQLVRTRKSATQLAGAASVEARTGCARTTMAHVNQTFDVSRWRAGRVVQQTAQESYTCDSVHPYFAGNVHASVRRRILSHPL